MQINNYIPLVYSWAYLVEVPIRPVIRTRDNSKVVKTNSDPGKINLSGKELMYIICCT